MKKRLFFNMGMLSLSNVIVRFVGMVYKVWLAKEISPIALGIYQLAMSVYSVFITPVASGLPNATSRLCAKYLKVGKEKNVLASAIKTAFYPLAISALLLFAGKDIIAGIFLHDKTAGNVVLALIPAVTLGALAALPCGLLHAKEKSYFSAIFEIVEQFGKIIFAFILIKMLKNATYQIQAMIPVLAVSFGGFISFFMHFGAVKGVDLKLKGFSKEILENAYPLTFARLGTSILHLGTTTILPIGLMAYGLTKEAALAQYGILTSMAYPVVFAPMTVIGALCVVTLPEIAKNLDNAKAIRYKFTQTFIIALIVTSIFSALLFLFAPWFSIRFFNNPTAGRFMVMLIPSVIFLGLSQVLRTMLNGLGKQKTLMITSVIDGSLGLLLTYILVWRFGIYGFVLGNCIQDFLAFIMNFFICIYHIKNIR